MASLCHFNPSQIYGGYKAVERLDPGCSEYLKKGKQCFQPYNPWSSRSHHCFVWKRPCQHPGAPISNAPTPGATSGYSNLTCSRQRDVVRRTNVAVPIPVGGGPIYSSSDVPITRINSQGLVKGLRRISDSTRDPNSEGSDELDGEEIEVVPKSISNPSSASPSQPASRRFQSQVIPSNPRNSQPILSTIPSLIPPHSPNTSTTSPASVSPVRPSPIPPPRNSPMVTSQQPQPVASSSRRREDQSPLHFPAAQVFQKRECWPIQVPREDPNMEHDDQDSVARLLLRADRNSREVITYANDRVIPSTSSEEMASKFAWYEDELINDFQRAFDDLGRDN
ncbi:hypothetical protein O181_000247 [Austropuccinia psidii MF-1]|uniref:Uncharacterized protein n=1 Tax=Austropuccinia psidii MF-1 TaxID=1389203 RepID=A0A9Q3B8H0_9BASI|nr:hypothetical protein [Austropuccinia psidii MF-1]